MKISTRFAIIILAAFASAAAFAQNFSDSFHWNHTRGFSPFSYASQSGIKMHNLSDTLIYDYYPLPEAHLDFNLSFRIKNNSAHPHKKAVFFNQSGQKKSISFPFWGFYLTTPADTIIISIKTIEQPQGIESNCAVKIEKYSLVNDKSETATVTKGINPYGDDNIWAVSAINNNYHIAAGNAGLVDIFSFFLTDQPLTGFGFIASAGADILISDINLEFNRSDSELEKHFDLSDLDLRFKQTDDSLEGYWMEFDRELEESLIKMGGDYKLACIKDHGIYYLIYLEGAVINSKNWKKGDVKAVLKPSPFPEIYDVVWVDAMKNSLSHDIKAQKGEGETLTFQFPYQASKIRVRKLAF